MNTAEKTDWTRGRTPTELARDYALTLTVPEHFDPRLEVPHLNGEGFSRDTLFAFWLLPVLHSHVEVEIKERRDRFATLHVLSESETGAVEAKRIASELRELPLTISMLEFLRRLLVDLLANRDYQILLEIKNLRLERVDGLRSALYGQLSRIGLS